LLSALPPEPDAPGAAVPAGAAAEPAADADPAVLAGGWAEPPELAVTGGAGVAGVAGEAGVVGGTGDAGTGAGAGAAAATVWLIIGLGALSVPTELTAVTYQYHTAGVRFDSV
jgi:hypothetical protein